VKVVFTAGGTGYTYASHVKCGCKAGDIVIVPVGKNDGDVFGQVNAMDSIQFAIVTHVTDDMSHIPKDFAIKHIVQRVDHDLYSRAINARP